MNSMPHLISEIIDYTKTSRDVGLTTSALVKNVKVYTAKLKCL